MVFIALIAVGCLGLSMWMPGRFEGIKTELMRLLASLCACTACGWLGGGVGLLFGRWRTCIVIGLVMQYLLVVGFVLLFRITASR
jgi:hypothetical protein